MADEGSLSSMASMLATISQICLPNSGCEADAIPIPIKVSGDLVANNRVTDPRTT